MQIVVLANEAQQQELLGGKPSPASVSWIRTEDELSPGATAYLDLLFGPHPQRIENLARLLPASVIVNSVTHTLDRIHPAFARINGWNTFLSGPLVEAAAPENLRAPVEALFSLFGKTVEWLPDEPGFVTPRIIGMIINEAGRALAEGVASAAAIDTAMKLGTNYPFGPFEWADRIGHDKVRELLTVLAKQNPKYEPGF